MSELRRVLVTGSRSWSDGRQVAAALEAERSDALREGADGILVVHGDTPGGLDALAAAWCAANGVPDEPHPAAWAVHGRDAGHIRNQEMVDAGAHVCLVFIGECDSGRCRRPKPHDSHDAHACSRLAAEAGIPLKRRTWAEAGTAPSR